MFTELNNILNASPESFTPGEFILLSDRQSDASFLIHHFLSFYLKARCKVCFVALVQSFSHYNAVSQRLVSPPSNLLRGVLLHPQILVAGGASLTQAKEKGQLIFLEGLKESLSVLIPQEENPENPAMSFLRDPAAGLCSLYNFVQSSVVASNGAGVAGAEQWGPPVLLIDDVSVLLSLGVRVGAVLDFSHYCRTTFCSQLQGNVVMLVRCDGEAEEDYADDEGSEQLMRGLTHQSCLTLRVQGLPTGYCRDIHGQVEFCWKKRQSDGQHMPKKVFQFKVHDKGVSFFARGTSSAVL